MTTTVYRLNPRTELFAVATYARARALAATADSERSALLALDDEWGWTAQHCYPGGPWERSNPKVAFLLAEAQREADAAGLPPFDLADPAAFLLDAAVTQLRNIYADRPHVTEVEFTAGPFGKRIEWRTITRAVTRYADGTERDSVSYPGQRLHHFLYDLAALRPPVTGDRLTLRVAPGPSAMPGEPTVLVGTVDSPQAATGKASAGRARPGERDDRTLSLLNWHEVGSPDCTCPKTACGGVIVTVDTKAGCPYHAEDPANMAFHQAVECPQLPPGTDTSRVWIVVLREVPAWPGSVVERAVAHAGSDRSALGPRRLQHLVEADTADAAEEKVRAQLRTWGVTPPQI